MLDGVLGFLCLPFFLVVSLLSGEKQIILIFFVVVFVFGP